MRPDRRFRWLLRLLPASFREDHERELLRVWREEEYDSSPRDRRRVWRDAFVDTAKVAPREHVAVWTRNLAWAFRRLRRSPVFAVTAILTLALGTGAAASVFSLVNAVLLRPLPWRAPEAVGLVWPVSPSAGRTWLSYPEVEDLRRDVTSLSAVAGLTDLRPHFLADGVGHELQALAVSHELFDLLGTAPVLGRGFTKDDDAEGAAPVVVLSHSFWQAQFGGDPAAVGRFMIINDRRHSVVGVLPPGFVLLPPSSVFPERADIWLPLAPHLVSRDRSIRFLHVIARLRDGATFAQANGELARYASQARSQFVAAYPGGAWSFQIVPFADDVLADARTALYALFGLVALVLVMACVNVANLLLVRGESRRHEIAIRAALGAGPARLAGELLAEAFVLAAWGSAAGLALAAAAPRVLRAIDPGALPRLDDAQVDVRVLAFMCAVVLLSFAIFASLPLVERLRLRGAVVLEGTRSGGRTRRIAQIGRALVIAQTALATTIIVTAVFLTQTFINVQRVDLGFAPERLLTARMSLSPKYPAGPAAAEFFDAAVAAAARAGGVTGAAAITQLPLSGTMLGSTFLAGAGSEEQRIDADLRGITPGYFEVMTMPLVAGRALHAGDTETTRPVAVVDEAFARRLARGDRTVGSRIRWFRQPDVEIEIVGVVASVHHRGASAPARETVYRPHRQYARASMFLAVKTSQEAAAAATAVRMAIAAVDASQPLADLATMEQRFERSIRRTRTSVMLASTLAAIALALAIVGLYGILSFGVAQRLREFGVLIALGASPGAVCGLVLGEGMLLTASGTTLGIGGAVSAARMMEGLFQGTGAGDLQPYLVGAALVLVCSAAAFWLPARRASAADPMTILRSD